MFDSIALRVVLCSSKHRWLFEPTGAHLTALSVTPNLRSGSIAARAGDILSGIPQE